MSVVVPIFCEIRPASTLEMGLPIILLVKVEAVLILMIATKFYSVPIIFKMVRLTIEIKSLACDFIPAEGAF